MEDFLSPVKKMASDSERGNPPCAKMNPIRQAIFREASRRIHIESTVSHWVEKMDDLLGQIRSSIISTVGLSSRGKSTGIKSIEEQAYGDSYLRINIEWSGFHPRQVVKKLEEIEGSTGIPVDIWTQSRHTTRLMLDYHQAPRDNSLVGKWRKLGDDIEESARNISGLIKNNIPEGFGVEKVKVIPIEAQGDFQRMLSAVQFTLENPDPDLKEIILDYVEENLGLSRDKVDRDWTTSSNLLEWQWEPLR